MTPSDPERQYDDPVPAPLGTFDELSDVELAALDVVMGAQGYRRLDDAH
jgi:hypothetical protein